ncbi:MAG: 2-C-methyl-D-erythritol 4-phosphate cytidylyltransferase [Candidatus Caccosoma sp.]|nr:2-C-methyl-D-erythritol 4-phosphate cytidylyltransferase [Candidatus Caccosoma sp.]
MKYTAIVLASGSSRRANIGYNKIFYKIDNIPVINLACKNFIDDDKCEKIIITYSNDEIVKLKELFNSSKIIYIKGGLTRQESVKNALNEVKSEYVLIHDGARPFVSNDLINRLVKELENKNVIIPVINVTDTIKVIKENKVVKTLNRDELKIVQTPQAFKTSLIKKAHEEAISTYFDDASLIEEVLKEDVYVIDGERDNIKLTYKEDFRG